MHQAEANGGWAHGHKAVGGALGWEEGACGRQKEPRQQRQPASAVVFCLSSFVFGFAPKHPKHATKGNIHGGWRFWVVWLVWVVFCFPFRDKAGFEARLGAGLVGMGTLQRSPQPMEGGQQSTVGEEGNVKENVKAGTGGKLIGDNRKRSGERGKKVTK